MIRAALLGALTPYPEARLAVVGRLVVRQALFDTLPEDSA